MIPCVQRDPKRFKNSCAIRCIEKGNRQHIFKTTLAGAIMLLPSAHIVRTGEATFTFRIHILKIFNQTVFICKALLKLLGRLL